MPRGPKGEKRPADITAPNPKKPSQKEQSERFKNTARELGWDETPGAVDRAFGKIDSGKRRGLNETAG
jgi:hypothetical protein